MVITPLHIREGLGGGSHLRAIGILVAQHVAGELNDHHLHAQTDAEGWNVVGTGIFCSNDLTLDATLTEARTYHDTRHAVELVTNILLCNLFAIDKV